jgi:hypothetical protein
VVSSFKNYDASLIWRGGKLSLFPDVAHRYVAEVLYKILFEVNQTLSFEKFVLLQT